MILVVTKHLELARELKRRFNGLGQQVNVVHANDRNILKQFYDVAVKGVVVDMALPGIPSRGLFDILNSLAFRVPVIVIDDPEVHTPMTTTNSVATLSELITTVNAIQVEEIINVVGVASQSGRMEIRNGCVNIPFYNVQIPTSMLHENGGLGILTIDASSFSKVGLEYGMDVYHKLKNVFHDILYNMWGKSGHFRANDVICRKSAYSNVYYVFLSRSRQTGPLPTPGALEMIADRVSTNIQNALWHELFENTKGKVPRCLQSVPVVGVGFFGILNNPCIDAYELIEDGLENSRKVSKAQIVRVKERQRELLQMFIQSEDLLVSHYQAIFKLGDISQAEVEQAKDQKSIAPLINHLFGFESLIRIDQKAVAKENIPLDGMFGIETRFIRPDLLFSMAKSSKVALELDQACLRHTAVRAEELPGVLMVNILPRNIYYIERLKDILGNRDNILFEVSESEAINNFDLLLRSIEVLRKHNMGIAADDFGRGFSSLERIITIRPQVVKFDRSIIQGIDGDRVKQAYVQGIVAAGKVLNATLLAEGVETWEEARVLQAMGIDLIQGFLLHKPQSADDILQQLGKTNLVSVA